MRKLLFLFVALLATTTVFGLKYYSPISVTDGTAADWDALPSDYVASATHTEGCSLDGLKSVKVYCDDNYLNILLEVNLDVVRDLEWTPFHIFLNADGSAETGGYGDLFADADSEWLLETAIYAYGNVNSYNPSVFKWWGEVGGSGWQWTDPTQEGSFENCWGAIVCEGSYPAVGTSQTVDGDLGKVEIQLLKELIPAQWANEFTIGFNIQQSWTTCGILPNAADDELGNRVLAEKLRVRTLAVLPQDGLHYEITSHVEPYTIAVVGADADITTANIPETIEVYGKTFAVTSIGGEAFQDCSSLTSIAIPNSIMSIGAYAFSGCSSLISLTIPSTVQFSEVDEDGNTEYDMGFLTIEGCYQLQTLIVPADFFGFSDAEDYSEAKYVLGYLPQNLESLTINDDDIHPFCFDFINQNRKTIKNIDLSATTNIIMAEEALKNCYKLETLSLPAQLEAIPYMAVAECKSLKSITIPTTVEDIDDSAFENCRMLSSVAFAENGALTRIGNWAFYNCHELTELVIPEGVTEVGHAAFYGCTYLKEMTLPSTVQSIADNGFALCAKLQRMNVDALIPPTVAARTFEEVDRSIPVYVPDEVIADYQTAPVWKEFNIQGKSNAPSALDDISSPISNNQKLLRDGQLLIIRDGKTYTIMGQEM